MTNGNDGKVCSPSTVRPYERKEREEGATRLGRTGEVHGVKLCLHDLS